MIRFSDEPIFKITRSPDHRITRSQSINCGSATPCYNQRVSGLTSVPEGEYPLLSSMAPQNRKIARFGIAIAIIVLCLGYLAYTGVQESKSYYVTINELNKMGDNAYTKRLRVGGNVQPGSI